MLILLGAFALLPLVLPWLVARIGARAFYVGALLPGAAFVYTAIPSGQKETEFRSTSISDTMFVVENPAHDFPTKISYRRVTADSVVAVVQGPGPNGMRGFAMGYGRVKCER